MGLPGLLCAKLGAAAVLLTDYEPVVVRHLAGNAALNGVQQRCTCAALDWSDPLGGSGVRQDQAHSWPLVLAADVLYVSAMAQPLLLTLGVLLHPLEGAAARKRWCLLGVTAYVCACRCALPPSPVQRFPRCPPLRRRGGAAGPPGPPGDHPGPRHPPAKAGGARRAAGALPGGLHRGGAAPRRGCTSAC